MPPARELRGALRNLSVKALSLGLERACRFLVIVACAPALGQVAFGRFVFASTATTLLALGTDLGLGVWTTRALARDRSDGARIVALGLALRACAVPLYAIAVALVAAFASSGEERAAITLLGAGALLGAFVDHFGAVLRGYERFVDEARLNATRALLIAAAGVATIAGHRSLLTLCVALAAANVASFAFGAATVLRIHPWRALPPIGLDGHLARAALRQAVPIWIASLLSVLYFKVDTLLLGPMAGEAELGAYGAAYKLFEGSMFVPAVVLSVAFPQLARAIQDPPQQRRLERRVTLFLLALGILVAGGLFVLDPLFVRVGFGRSVASLHVLALGVPLVYVNYGLTHFLIARDLGRMTTYFALGMLALNVSLNLALIPRALGPGAAWATVLTEVGLTACCVGALRPGARPGRSEAAQPVRGAARTDQRGA